MRLKSVRRGGLAALKGPASSVDLGHLREGAHLNLHPVLPVIARATRLSLLTEVNSPHHNNPNLHPFSRVRPLPPELLIPVISDFPMDRSSVQEPNDVSTNESRNKRT